MGMQQQQQQQLAAGSSTNSVSVDRHKDESSQDAPCTNKARIDRRARPGFFSESQVGEREIFPLPSIQPSVAGHHNFTLEAAAAAAAGGSLCMHAVSTPSIRTSQASTATFQIKCATGRCLDFFGSRRLVTCRVAVGARERAPTATPYGESVSVQTAIERTK